MLNFSNDTSTVIYLIDIINNRLESLSESKFNNNLFNKGQAVAYRACLNMLSSWEDASNYDIELPKSKKPILYPNLSADDLLICMIHEICCRLDKIHSIEESYNKGLKTAYVECLEVIQNWEYASLFGINFDIEVLYPII